MKNTPSPADAGMFARAVADVTGLSESELYGLHASDMGSPGHFRYVSGVGGGFFYTPKGLGRLVEILHAEGRKVAALVLAEALRLVLVEREVGIPKGVADQPRRPWWQRGSMA